jgi:hypothetical protein
MSWLSPHPVRSALRLRAALAVAMLVMLFGGVYASQASAVVGHGWIYPSQSYNRDAFCVQVAIKIVDPNRPLATDGIYGSKTVQAVKDFQNAWIYVGHSGNGVYDSDTGDMMNYFLKQKGRWNDWTAECFWRTPGAWPGS